MTNSSNVNCEVWMCIILIYFFVNFFSSKMKSTRRIRDAWYCWNNSLKHTWSDKLEVEAKHLCLQISPVKKSKIYAWSRKKFHILFHFATQNIYSRHVKIFIEALNEFHKYVTKLKPCCLLLLMIVCFKNIEF